MAVELKVPEVGESITEVFINRWLKTEGDHVEKDETVAELETEKATFELPAPVSGTLSSIDKPKGQTASIGEVIAHLEEGEQAAGKATKQAKAKPGPRENQEQKEAEKPSGDQRKKAAAQSRPQAVEVEPRIMPAARHALVEHGLKAEDVEATGPGGRLLKEDVMRHVVREQRRRERPAAAPGVEADRHAAVPVDGREEEIVPMSPMRQTIARRLVEAQQSAALLTTFNEVDMSAVQALRSQYKDRFAEQYETKLGFMSFFLKAAVDALRRFPALNAEIRDGQSIVYRNYFDIGIAVSTPKGLIVPVIRDAQRLSFAEIEQQVLDLAERGKQNKIGLKELGGGTFTITNGGVFGSLLSTPIVNPPQSGVLGMHAIQDRPVVVGGQVVVRPMMYIALTYDHRIVDGREAVTFLKRIKECIEDPARMLMEV